MTIKNADGNIYQTERAAADADIAGDGQIWVETATPTPKKNGRERWPGAPEWAT